MVEGELQEDFYVVKYVDYYSRVVPLICQNRNGPCPLLAIANALLLRGSITLPAGTGEIAQSAVIRRVAEFMLEQAGRPDLTEEERANVQQNVSDALSAVPKLATGIDVNVRFTSPDAFEFTDEVAIFDLVHVPLLHGWVCDPQDADSHKALGSMTYNEVVNFIVRCTLPTPPVTPTGGAPAAPALPSAVPGATVPVIRAPDAAEEVPDSEAPDIADLLALDIGAGAGEVAGEVAGAEVEVVMAVGEDGGVAVEMRERQTRRGEGFDARPSAGRDREASEGGRGLSPLPTEEGAAAGAAALEAVSGAAASAGAEAGQAPGVTEEEAWRARVLREWLSATAGQLTHHGVERLHALVDEGGLSVLFRNNHFSTATKHDGRLYLLVTDQGFDRETNIVWESLVDIRGESAFFDGSFRPSGDPLTQQHVGAAAADPAPGAGATPAATHPRASPPVSHAPAGAAQAPATGAEEEGTDEEDEELRMALEMSRREAEAEAARRAVGQGGGQGDEEAAAAAARIAAFEADAAMAAQLQEEFDREVAAAAAEAERGGRQAGAGQQGRDAGQIDAGHGDRSAPSILSRVKASWREGTAKLKDTFAKVGSNSGQQGAYVGGNPYIDASQQGAIRDAPQGWGPQGQTASLRGGQMAPALTSGGPGPQPPQVAHQSPPQPPPYVPAGPVAVDPSLFGGAGAGAPRPGPQAQTVWSPHGNVSHNFRDADRSAGGARGRDEKCVVM